MAKHNCKTCGKPSLKEYCFLHNPKNGIKYSPPKAKKRDEYKGEYSGLTEFYEELWAEREHYCFETGKWLGNKFDIRRFHHVLHKSSYPQYAYSKWNVVILDSDVHELCHSDLDKCPKVKELTEHLRENRII
jgi:hypothetical protein